MAFPSGLSAFPITPSDRDGRVDAGALRKLVARLCAVQVNTIGLLGSTGTYMFLSREERRRALAEVLHETGGRTPVIVGVGQSAENIGDSSYRGMSSVELAALSDTGVDTAARDFRTDARAAGQVEQLLADGCAAYRR